MSTEKNSLKLFTKQIKSAFPKGYDVTTIWWLVVSLLLLTHSANAASLRHTTRHKRHQGGNSANNAISSGTTSHRASHTSKDMYNMCSYVYGTGSADSTSNTLFESELEQFELDLDTHFQDMILNLKGVTYKMKELMNDYVSYLDIEKRLDDDGTKILVLEGLPVIIETLTNESLYDRLIRHYHDLVRIYKLLEVVHIGESNHHSTDLAPTFQELLGAGQPSFAKLLCDIHLWMKAEQFRFDRTEIDIATQALITQHLRVLTEHTDTVRRKRDGALLDFMVRYLDQLTVDVMWMTKLS